jgi:hypothetical protein
MFTGNLDDHYIRFGKMLLRARTLASNAETESPCLHEFRAFPLAHLPGLEQPQLALA